MPLKPLEQFICDKCGEIINKPEEGWIEWISEINNDDYKVYGFKIVHHSLHSPLKRGGCYHYTNHSGRSDSHLNHFLENCIIQLLSFLDQGPYLSPEYKGPRVKDMREFVKLTRRLTIPYYEEARLYFGEAESDGVFDGANPISFYLPDTLEYIVETYSDNSDF